MAAITVKYAYISGEAQPQPPFIFSRGPPPSSKTRKKHTSALSPTRRARLPLSSQPAAHILEFFLKTRKAQYAECNRKKLKLLPKRLELEHTESTLGINWHRLDPWPWLATAQGCTAVKFITAKAHILEFF